MVKTKQAIDKKELVNTNTNLVNSKETLDALIERVKKAQREYAFFTQEQVDKIFKVAATAADKARISLAKMAVADTGMGIIEDKIIKNHYASEYIFNKHKKIKLTEQK